MKTLKDLKTINLPTGCGNIRSSSTKLDKIVIHAMSEYIDYEGEHMHASTFLNRIGLSCHYMISPSGNIIQCGNPSELRAWHAKGHNLTSIGIEILVPGLNSYSEFIKTLNHSWVSSKQYQALAELCAVCMDDYDMILRCERHIFGHDQLDPKRKKDPGKCFNWEFLFTLIEHQRG